jgi:hypothetical protein
METIFFDDKSRYTYLPDDMRSFYDDDRLVANSDIKYAYDKLPQQYKKVLFEVYALKYDVDKGNKDRFYRAINRMVDILNTYNKIWEHDGLGNRKVISNAQARAIIDNQENGGYKDIDGYV